MSWNGLRRLPVGLFRGAPRLGLLRLSHNALSQLPGALLAGLERLEELDLAGNRLDGLPPDLFAGLGATLLGREPARVVAPPAGWRAHAAWPSQFLLS